MDSAAEPQKRSWGLIAFLTIAVILVALLVAGWVVNLVWGYQSPASDILGSITAAVGLLVALFLAIAYVFFWFKMLINAIHRSSVVGILILLFLSTLGLLLYYFIIYKSPMPSNPQPNTSNTSVKS